MKVYDYNKISKTKRATLILKIDQLRLSKRSVRILKEELGYTWLYELLPLKKVNLLKIPSYGEKSWIELENIFSNLDIDVVASTENFTRKNVSQGAEKYRKRMARIIQGKLQAEIDSLPKENKSLQSELAYNISLISEPNDKLILFSRWGWNGLNPQTLEAIGANPSISKRVESLSRERVRQIVKKSKSELSKVALRKEVTTEVYDFVINQLPCTITTLQKRIKRHPSVNAHFSLNGILIAGELLLDRHDIKIDNNYRYAHEKDKAVNVKSLLKAITKETGVSGGCDLRSFLGFKRMDDGERRLVKEVLSADVNYLWLDKGENWISHRMVRNRLENTLHRIFSVVDELPFEKLVVQTKKNKRLKRYLPNDILRAYLSSLEFLDLRHNTVKSLYRMDYSFGGAEQIILQYLPSEKGLYNKDILMNHWIDQGYEEGTLEQILYGSSIVENLGNREFRLIGQNRVSSAKLNADQGEVHDDEVSFPEALDRSLDRMVNSVNSTVKASGKKKKVKKSKRKKLKMTKNELRKLLKEMIKEQEYVCKLTGLQLDVLRSEFETDYMPSLDRIDSDGHYSPENLQIVCWFANRWKRDDCNDRFLELISVLKSGVSVERYNN